MKVYEEFSFDKFQPWDGAVSRYNRIREEGKGRAFEAFLEEVFPEGADKGQINDLLWFEHQMVFEALGMKTEEQLEAEEESSANFEFYMFNIELSETLDEYLSQVVERLDSGAVEIEDIESKLMETFDEDEVETALVSMKSYGEYVTVKDGTWEQEEGRYGSITCVFDADSFAEDYDLTNKWTEVER